MTVLDLITRSMRLLGALNISGDPPEAAETQIGFAALNAMVDAWGTERLMMYTTARTVYPITAGVQTYLLGPNTSGTDWQGARPLYVDGAGLILTDGSGSERPLYVITSDDEWRQVRIKTLQSTLPTAVYYQPDFPANTFIFWPAPTIGQSVALYTPTAVSQFTSLTQSVSLPPGYARALPYNLAVEMAPEFDREASATVIEIAMQSKADIKRVNAPKAIGRLRADEAASINRRGAGAFDWMTGEIR